ncbi:response regulator [Gilvibacter sediminis]|uniref:response regulator n=1 Tax=Gilvibacter sediminis TaxID=379071 RepID=UPI0023501068|nr:response regulator [Gilvibacter sediminis]MDC7996511.1 response regulator [Gilvibacter sediminis]
MIPLLIIEDDFVLATEWIKALEKLGRFKVMHVTSAEEAQRKVDFAKVDLYIIDLFYFSANVISKKQGGIRLIGPIRRMNPNAKIIVVTSHNISHGIGLTTEDIIKNLGADYFLEKPFNVNKLTSLIDTIESKFA